MAKRGPKTPEGLARVTQNLPWARGGEKRRQHGALAVRTTQPETQALVENLVGILEGDLGMILRPADRPALEAAAVLIRQRQRLEAYLDKRGPVDSTGKVRPAAELLVKVEESLLKYLTALGMTPAGRAKLGFDTARTIDVARLLAEAAPEAEAPISDDEPNQAPAPNGEE